MFNKSEQDLSLADRLVRHAVALRIAMALLAFFSVAWCLLQWALGTEPRFMAEGIVRQFVLLEAAVCAVLAALAFIFMLASGLAWAATAVKMRRQQNGAARRLAMKHTTRRVGAYV